MNLSQKTASFRPVIPKSSIFDLLPSKFLNNFDTIEYKDLRIEPDNSKNSILHLSESLTLDSSWALMSSNKFLKFLNKANFQRLSFDLGPCHRKVIEINGVYVGSESKISRDKILKIAGTRINWLKKNIPHTCSIAVENLNYYCSEAYEDVCCPDIYNEICRDNGIGIVLDLPHAQISAYNFCVNFDEHLSLFDKTQIVECHLSKMGYSKLSRKPIDSHEAPDSLEFSIVSDILSERSSGSVPIDIVIEYYKDPKILVDSYYSMFYCLEKNMIG